MWQFEFSTWLKGAPSPPVLTPEAAALAAKRKAAREKGYVRALQNILCLPTGFPALMMWRSPIEIDASPGRLSIVTEHDPGYDEPRTIYLNEKTQPADIDPSWNGHSIGRFEGDTLAVDTVGFNGRQDPGFARVGPGTHVTERFHLTQGGRKLLDDITFEDPAIYARPYTITLTYDRLPAESERMEAVCEVDLEALKNLDLNSVKDVDPEAERLLDPAHGYNAAGTEADAASRAAGAQGRQ
jgi:hypothetical protein